MNRNGYALVILALFALPLGAETWADRLSYSFRGSVFAFPEGNGLESDPTPILPSAGAALAYHLSGIFWAELSLDIYSTQYGYSETLNRAVPLALENRWTTAIGLVFGFQALARIPLTERMSLRVYGGPGIDLRVCYTAADLNADEQDKAAQQTSLVTDYFWGQGRWLLPVFGTGMDFKMTSKFDLGFDLRVWFPVYKLWTGEGLPPQEGWRFGGGLRITIR